MVENLSVGLAREVGALDPPRGDPVDHTVDHLLHAPLALRRGELPAEILRRDHVRRGRRPELGYFDASLLEDVAALARDHRIAQLPFDLVVGVHALVGEIALQTQALAWRRRGNGLLRQRGDGHEKPPLTGRDGRYAVW